MKGLEKFVNEHPKAYKSIVAVLAFLAFLVVTFGGLLRVKTASAAISATMDDFGKDVTAEDVPALELVNWDVDNGKYQHVRDRLDGWLVFARTDFSIYYFINYVAGTFGCDKNGFYYIQLTYGEPNEIFTVYANGRKPDYTESPGNPILYLNKVDNALGAPATYLGRYSESSSSETGVYDSLIPAIEPEHFMQTNRAYALNGKVLSRTSPTWNTDIYFNYSPANIGLLTGFTFGRVGVKATYRLVSPSIVRQWIDGGETPLSIIEKDTLIDDWRYSNGNSGYVLLAGNCDGEVCERSLSANEKWQRKATSHVLRFYPLDVLADYTSETGSPFAALYSDVLTDEEISAWSNVILTYMSLDSVELLQYATDFEGNEYYGKKNIVKFAVTKCPYYGTGDAPKYVFNKYYSYGYDGNFVEATDTILENLRVESINKADSKLLEEKEQAELNAEIYKQQFDSAQAMMKSEGVFDVFNGLADGLKNASAGLSSLASATGTVLGFLPAEVTLSISAVVIILLFIAIYKGVRG